PEKSDKELSKYDKIKKNKSSKVGTENIAKDDFTRFAFVDILHDNKFVEKFKSFQSGVKKTKKAPPTTTTAGNKKKPTPATHTTTANKNKNKTDKKKDEDASDDSGSESDSTKIDQAEVQNIVEEQSN